MKILTRSWPCMMTRQPCEIAGKYREEKVGLASLLSMVADDVADCAAMLDDTEGKSME